MSYTMNMTLFSIFSSSYIKSYLFLVPLNIEEQCCKASLHLDEIQNKVTEIIKRKTVTADEFLIEELEKDNTL